MKRRAPHKLVVVDGSQEESAAAEATDERRVGDVEATTRARLESAELLDDPSGMAALALARRIDRSILDTGAGVAALVREHRAALADAMSRGKVAADPLERLRLVAAEKSAGA